MTQEDLDKTRWLGTSYSLETDQFEVSFSDTTNCIPKLTMIKLLDMFATASTTRTKKIFLKDVM